MNERRALPSSEVPSTEKTTLLEQRLREGAEAFAFDALLHGVESEEPSRRSPQPKIPGPLSSAAVPSPSPPAPSLPAAQKRPVPPSVSDDGTLGTSLFLRLLLLAAAGIAIAVSFSLWLQKPAPDQRVDGNAAVPAAATSAVAPASHAGDTQAATVVKPASSVARPGVIQVRRDAGVGGALSYWFVTASGKATRPQPLPAPEADGVVTLIVPAQFNRTGAHLRVLRADTGKVARVPLLDVSAPAYIVQPQVGDDLLVNGTFEQKTRAWTLEQTGKQAKGTMRVLDAFACPPGVAGRAARFDVTALGAENWHVQCFQPGLTLKNGHSYLVAFWARADADRKLSVDLIQDRAPWQSVGLHAAIALTPQWRKYTRQFVARNALKGHSRLGFILGDRLGGVEVAAVSLRPLHGRNQAIPVPAQGAMLLSERDFQ